MAFAPCAIRDAEQFLGSPHKIWALPGLLESSFGCVSPFRCASSEPGAEAEFRGMA